MELVVFSLNYSSWSVRAWLALDHAGAGFSLREIGGFVDPGWRQELLQISGAGKVPVLLDGDLRVHEALAICEYVAERFPDAGLWPADAAQRARARAISCEMASGFPDVRGEMPMNYRGRAGRYRPGEQAAAQVARIQQLWSECLQRSGGPFLFGDFSIADCMYAPVHSRFRTYGIELSGDCERYADAIWQQPSVRRWGALAERAASIPMYDELLARLA
jgi:glutathione S-transferase